MPSPDDERLGHLFRKVRRRSGLTQEQVASSAGVTVEDLHLVEAGEIDQVRVGRARAAFAAVGGRLYLNPWWHGASADRLLDEDHAAIVERAAAVFTRRGWRVIPELTFAEFGERGSIDLFAGHDLRAAVAVCEIKSVFGSLEETNRSLDVKVRLAPKIAERIFGWRPAKIGRLLIVPDETTVRRVVGKHETTMAAAYPDRGRAVRAWLRNPDRPMAGIWFVSFPAVGGTDAD
jgi:transcriptional regulator with XRE-family HTH domain